MLTKFMLRLLCETPADGGSGGGEPDPDPDPEPTLTGAAATSALKKERKARADAEKRARDLEARFKRLEDAEKSETERLRSELAEVKREQELAATERERERTERTRGDLVRRAAKDFDDPDDVIAILGARGLLDDVEDEREADRVVKALAKEKPHLLRKAAGGSGLEQVLKNGQPVDTQADAQGAVERALGLGQKSGDEMYAMSDEQFVAWKKADPEGYRKSLEGWTGNELTARTSNRAAITQ